MSIPFKFFSAATIAIGLTVPALKAQAISLQNLNNGTNITIDDQTYSNWNVPNQSSSVDLSNIEVTGISSGPGNGVEFNLNNEISASSSGFVGSDSTFVEVTYQASVSSGSNPIVASDLAFPTSADVNTSTATSFDSAGAIVRDFGNSGIGGGNIRNEIEQERSGGTTTSVLSDSASFAPQQTISVANSITVNTNGDASAQIQTVDQRFTQVPYEIETGLGVLTLGALLGGRKLLGIYRKRRFTNS